MPTTITTRPAVSPIDAAEHPAVPGRKRRSAPRGKLPAETSVRLSGDGKTVIVALHGTYGAGKFMILDADVWASVSATHGEAWCLNADGSRRRWYVRRGGQHVAAAARQRGERPTASLARLITGAGPREVVLYRNGDRLDLRRVNLEVVSRAEAAKRRRLITSAR